MNEFSYLGYGVVLINNFPSRSHQPLPVSDTLSWNCLAFYVTE